MRILHFNQFGAYAGGVEGYIADVSAALSEAGHMPSLVHFTPHEGNDLLSRSIGVPLAEAAKPGAAVFEQLQRAVDTLRPDIAFIHAVHQPELVRWIVNQMPAIAYVHSPYLVCPGYAQYWRESERTCIRAAGVACLYYAQTEHCCFGRSPVRHVKRLLSVKALVAAYQELHVLVGSRFMQQLLALNGLPERQISILPPVLFSDLPALSAPEPTTILFAGRIVPEKGLHLLIEALAQVGVAWKLIVAGDGRDLGRCRRLAEALQLADRVHFVGWQDAAGMARLYQQSAVVAVPSLWPEPYGRIGPEAFTYGRPVVAFDVGGVSDWLQDGVTGFLVPAGHVEAFGQGLGRLLTAEVVKPESGRQVQEHARDLWSTRAHLTTLMSRPEFVAATG